jgi:hypothetical protein
LAGIGTHHAAPVRFCNREVKPARAKIMPLPGAIDGAERNGSGQPGMFRERRIGETEPQEEMPGGRPSHELFIPSLPPAEL